MLIGTRLLLCHTDPDWQINGKLGGLGFVALHLNVTYQYTWEWLIANYWQTPQFRRSGIQKRNGITPCICMINRATNATISCKILVKIGRVVSAENILIDIESRVHVVVRRISSNISGCTGPIFAIFTSYERALRADDGSVPYFPIWQGTLQWKLNNIAVMKAFARRGARFRFATTC